MPGPEAPRPPRRPRPEPVRRSPTYKASVALAILFLGLALSLPLWLDKVRQPVDRGVLDTDLADVKAMPGAGPRAFVPPPPPPVSATAAPRGSASAMAAAMGATDRAVNADCRAYVYARCNALRIEASDCLPIALDAMGAKVEDGMTGCHEVVDGRLKAAAAMAGVREEEPAPSPDVLVSPDARVAPGGDAGPAGGAASTAGKASASGKPGAAPGAAPGTEPPALPPSQRAEKLEKALVLVEELQRGANNYGTLPAAQDARMAELRSLVEAEGSPAAKALYNRLVERYRAAPPPEPGSVVGESPRQESGYSDGPAPASTQEMDQVRGLANEARREAGLPPQPAPDPADALRVRSPSETPAAQEYRP